MSNNEKYWTTTSTNEKRKIYPNRALSYARSLPADLSLAGAPYSTACRSSFQLRVRLMSFASVHLFSGVFRIVTSILS